MSSRCVLARGIPMMTKSEAGSLLVPGTLADDTQDPSLRGALGRGIAVYVFQIGDVIPNTSVIPSQQGEIATMSLGNDVPHLCDLMPDRSRARPGTPRLRSGRHSGKGVFPRRPLPRDPHDDDERGGFAICTRHSRAAPQGPLGCARGGIVVYVFRRLILHLSFRAHRARNPHDVTRERSHIHATLCPPFAGNVLGIPRRVAPRDDISRPLRHCEDLGQTKQSPSPG